MVTRSNFSESNFDLVTLIYSEFKSVDCNRSRWAEAQLNNVSLEECELNSTDFSGARLQDCKFTGCSLVGSNWHKIDVDLFLSESQRSQLLPVDEERLKADLAFSEYVHLDWLLDKREKLRNYQCWKILRKEKKRNSLLVEGEVVSSVGENQFLLRSGEIAKRAFSCIVMPEIGDEVLCIDDGSDI